MRGVGDESGGRGESVCSECDVELCADGSGLASLSQSDLEVGDGVQAGAVAGDEVVEIELVKGCGCLLQSLGRSGYEVGSADDEADGLVVGASFDVVQGVDESGVSATEDDGSRGVGFEYECLVVRDVVCALGLGVGEEVSAGVFVVVMSGNGSGGEGAWGDSGGRVGLCEEAGVLDGGQSGVFGDADVSGGASW